MRTFASRIADLEHEAAEFALYVNVPLREVRHRVVLRVDAYRQGIAAKLVDRLIGNTVERGSGSDLVDGIVTACIGVGEDGVRQQESERAARHRSHREDAEARTDN